ncbi:MAG TPA: hypothetical protein VLA48_02480 [Nitrososphaeraceae archaeon]|nr:hypothetical protein [Nitrososphaeraceae archaeon]
MRILKITTLPPAKEVWIDRDMIMLHSCFQLLIDFVEKEDGLNHCNYEAHKKDIDECKALYDWWKENNSDLTDLEVDEHLMRLIKVRSFMWT